MVNSEEQDGENEPDKMVVNSVAWINEDEIEDGLLEMPLPPPPRVVPARTPELPMPESTPVRPTSFALGFNRLDTLGRPLGRGEVVLVAGGAGVGKTSWLMNVGHTMAQAGAHVFMFDAQGDEAHFAERTGQRLSLQLRQLGHEPDDDFVWAVTQAEFQALPFWVEHGPVEGLDALYARIGQAIEEQHVLPDVILFEGVDEVLGDDPALLQRGMRELKAIARELDVAILCTVSTRARRERVEDPHLEDLEELEPLCRGADRVLYLQRFNCGSFEHPDDSLVAVAYVKNRRGELAEELLAFWATQCLFLSDTTKLLSAPDRIPF